MNQVSLKFSSENAAYSYSCIYVFQWLLYEDDFLSRIAIFFRSGDLIRRYRRQAGHGVVFTHCQRYPCFFDWRSGSSERRANKSQEYQPGCKAQIQPQNIHAVILDEFSFWFGINLQQYRH